MQSIISDKLNGMNGFENVMNDTNIPESIAKYQGRLLSGRQPSTTINLPE